MKSKKENIAEYILYLWQLEDVVRACPNMVPTSRELMDIEQMMRSEGVSEKGHIQLAANALSQLNDMHSELLEADATYRASILRLQPSLALLKSKTDTPQMSDMEMMFVFLHGIMTLRLQKKEISAETLALQQQITAVLTYLSKLFRDDN